jgi:hypothetical protein
VLQLNNAGWHRPENLAVPDGIRQPAHEVQPAEHLWRFVDELLDNGGRASRQGRNQLESVSRHPNDSERLLGVSESNSCAGNCR